MKKKCILAIIGIFLMSFNTFSDSTIQDNKEVLTEITPGPAKIVSGYKGAKEGVQTIFTYSEDSMYTIYTRVNYITSILLQPGESVGFVGGGDTARWRRATARTGSSDGEREVIYIKPTSIGLKTNLIINTDKRTYQINLISDKNLYNPLIKWQYPDDEMVKQIKIQNDLKVKEENEEKIDMDNLNYDYTLSTNKYRFSPSQVFDDGKKTIIILKENLQELPVLYILDDSKEGYVVNYRIKGQGKQLVVDRLFDKAELVLDRKKVIIKRKK